MVPATSTLGGTTVAGTLKIENLSKTFPGQAALIGVDLDIAVGEVHALVGQNGSGKSTLIKVLAGYHQPDPGSSAWVNEQPLTLGDSHAAAQTTGLNATTRTPGAAQNPSPVGSAPVTALPALQRPAAPDLTRHGMDDSVHPAIQAALRWVRGDQSAASDDADRAAQRQDSSNAAAEANSHSERMSSALARSTPAALVPSHGLPLPARAASFGSPPSGSPSQARSELAHKLVQDFALDFDLADSAKPLRAQSRSARADRDSAPMNHDAAAAASASTDRVEISIGSIHVKVDAPAPPRSQTLPAPAPQRPAVTPAASHAASQAAAPAAAQAAMHSAFSRSRLPR